MSIAIGVVIAVVYFLTSTFLSTWALKKRAGLAQSIVLSGFLARLTLLGVIFYLLWRFFQVRITDCLITFIVAYTLILPITVKLLAKSASGRDVLFSSRR